MTKSDIIDYLKTKAEISHKVFIMEIHFFIEKITKNISLWLLDEMKSWYHSLIPI